MDVTVRPATPADEPALFALHRGEQEFGGRWFTNPFAGGKEARYEDLTPAQRWLHGGPWMDPQLLSLHLQRFAANGGTVLVAERGDRLVGSVELWRAEEPLPFGAYLAAATLVADRRHGAGADEALFAAALAEARRRDLRALDIAPLQAGGGAGRAEREGFLLLRDHRTLHVEAGRRPSPPDYAVRNAAPAHADLRDMIAMNHVEPPEFRLGTFGNEWAGGLLRDVSKPFGGVLRVGFAEVGVAGRVCTWLPEKEAEFDLWVPVTVLGNVPWWKRAVAATLDYIAKHHRVARFRTTAPAHLAPALEDLGFVDGGEPDPYLRRHLSSNL